MSEKLLTAEPTSYKAIIDRMEEDMSDTQAEPEKMFTRLEMAQATVDALNFKSSSEDRIYANKELQAANETPDYSAIGDIVTIGKNNKTFHGPNGKFMSKYYLDEAYNHQDQIREGLEGRGLPIADSEPIGAEEPVSEPEHFADAQEKTPEESAVAPVDTLEDVQLAPLSEEATKIDTLEDITLAEVPATEDEKLDTSGLDAEQSSIWKRIRKGTQDRYLKAATLFGTAMYAAGNVLPKPTPKDGEKKEDFEKRVRRIGFAKVVGFVAVVALAKFGFDQLDFGDPESIGASGGGISTPESEVPVPEVPVDTPAEVPVEAPVTPEFSAEALNVTSGEGWYNTFDEMGITDRTEQANLLQKVGPQLQANGWAYPMEGGSWGISHPGQLPADVLELIKNSR